MFFRRGLWVCCHVVYSIFMAVGNIWTHVNKFVERHLYATTLENEMLYVSKCAEHFNKTPQHIVLLLGNETISYKDLANIILWCVAAGISFVTLYDHDGHLQQNQDELYQAVKTRSKLCVGTIIWGRNKTLNGLGVENGVQNGTKAIAKTRVTVLSLNDSKETFLKVTRSLCYSAKNREVKSCHISQDVINEMLIEETGLPEPELALYCGEVCCTYGFLPWHIRITEFLRLRSHHNITVREFARLLQTYGKCEQRFGK
ncbi:dehydrodolichyl diphosphate synthase complex subunit nus1 isoform X1 [Schistocerca nitens]|uniref:dehydrodolichyl diphosphate synthase complex subunit nus1 isoform X1 n=1 Tax=Schistocerca nitens TaxID=7011 RepID=UPI0021176CD3|nr:dehydrodolichyl diphosphate synthase complex subunit nus1 isoform X1 [Schistocerca nitens]